MIDFRREEVDAVVHERAVDGNRFVKRVFDTVSTRYDLMNDLMSLGSHRFLKQVFLESTGIHRGHHVLDIAGGTGDIARLIAGRVGPEGSLTVLDMSEAMTKFGRNRQINAGYAATQFVLADAQSIPCRSETFDCVTIGFGIRNMDRIDQALTECHRVLKPGGQLSVLEFSQPELPQLNVLFDLYRRTWPIVGSLVVGDPLPYQYLVESIDRHPTQHAMQMLFEASDFKQCNYNNLLGGIVAIHTGKR